MKRDDYPNDDEEEENCIKRAQSRVGEELYSLDSINCESYVNWVFSNDNTSKQITISIKNQIIGNAFDGVFSTGVLRLLLHLAFLENQISHDEEKKEEQEGGKEEKKEDKEEKNEDENRKAISISNLKYLKIEKENSDPHETETKEENLHSYIRRLVSIEEKLQLKMQEESHQTEEHKENLLNDIDNLKMQKEELQKIIQELLHKMEEKDINMLIYIHLLKGIEEKIQEYSFHRKKPQETNKSIDMITNLLTPMAHLTENEEDKEQTQFVENETVALQGQIEKMPKRHNDRILRRLLENGMLSNRIPNSTSTSSKPPNNEEEETQTHFEENEAVALRGQRIARRPYRPFDGNNNHPLVLGIFFLSLSMGTLYPNNTHLSQKRIEHDGEFVIVSKQLGFYGHNRNPLFPNTALERRMTTNLLSLTQSTIFWKCFFHILILIRQIYIIRNNDFLTPNQKINSIAKEFFSTVCGVAGSVLVQAFFPIPFIGSLFYGMIGHAVGGIIGGFLFPRLLG